MRVPASPALDEASFRLFQTLLLREAGVYLAAGKQAMVAARLGRRVKALGLRSFHDYYRRVQAGDEAERAHLLDALTTHETRFFREPSHFQFLERQALPALLAQPGRRRLRAWSAACSTGEEAYSLGMLLLAALPPGAGVEAELLASDISERVVAQARRGIYPLERAGDIPPELLPRFMLRGVRGQRGHMRAGPELRALVRFECFNLATARWPRAEPFDLILCRNVLMYFDETTRARVVASLLDRLTPSGFLFLGHAESLAGSEARVRCVQPTIYARRPK
jgi:chemotaxis protein methyltransferase CheR